MIIIHKKIKRNLKKAMIYLYEKFKGNRNRYRYGNQYYRYSKKVMEHLMTKEYFKDKRELVLLILFYLIIILFALTILIFIICVLVKQINNEIYYTNFSQKKISNDAWLGFLGSILGSVVTMLGIIITIKFERRKEEIGRRKQAQPIIMIQQRKKDKELYCGIYKSEYYIYFYPYDRGKNNSGRDKIELQIPDMILRNIGFYAAINIEAMFYIDGMEWITCSALDYLPPNEYEAIRVGIVYYEEDIKRIFRNIWYKKEGDKETSYAYFINVFSDLKEEFYDKIEFVTRNKGSLKIKYQDVYGNRYCNYYNIWLWLVKLNDDNYISFMTYHNYSRTIK